MSNTCIDIAVRRIGDILSFESERLGEVVSFRTERDGKGIDFTAHRASEMLDLGVRRNGEPMSFRCGLVCSVGSDFYLRVEPDAIWLLPDSAEVAVFSNVTWYIE